MLHSKNGNDGPSPCIQEGHVSTADNKKLSKEERCRKLRRETSRLSGQMATCVRHLVGGRDITTGASVSPVSLMETPRILNKLREIVDSYDAKTLELQCMRRL